MTAIEIAALSDRDLDAMVAEKVMDYERDRYGDWIKKGSPSHWPSIGKTKCYFTVDPLAMFSVLVRLRELLPHRYVQIVTPYVDASNNVYIGEVNIWGYRKSFARVRFLDVDRLPRAVCEAALLAVEGKP